MQWGAWAFFNREVADLNTADREELLWLIAWYADQIGWKFPPAPPARKGTLLIATRLSLDEVRVTHRPLVAYAVTSVILSVDDAIVPFAKTMTFLSRKASNLGITNPAARSSADDGDRDGDGNGDGDGDGRASARAASGRAAAGGLRVLAFESQHGEMMMRLDQLSIINREIERALTACRDKQP